MLSIGLWKSSDPLPEFAPLPKADMEKTAEDWPRTYFLPEPMKYFLTSLLTLVTLAIGIAIGLLIAPRIGRPIGAAGLGPQASQPESAAAPTSTQPTSTGQKITMVRPMMTGGSIGVYLVLAHHVQSDELVVNGYDILKLQQGELNLLSHFVPQSEIESMVQNSKASELFRVENPSVPAAPKPVH